MQVPEARDSFRPRNAGTWQLDVGLERTEGVKVRALTGPCLLQMLSFCLEDGAE